MKKIVYTTLFLLCTNAILSQELFSYSEPASNVPSKSFGVRVNSMLMRNTVNRFVNFHTMPEFFYGINKNLMVRGQQFLSNRTNTLLVDGGSVYAKYRFLSNDEMHKHFRMAAFARYSYNKGYIHQEEIETQGFNSGYEVGMVATQLMHKYALSGSISYEKAFSNGEINKFPTNYSSDATNLTLSVGKLLLPKNYTNFKQVNVNAMVEVLGQRLNSNGKYFVDVAPTLQFIINSQARLDIGYRKQIYSNMLRKAPNGFMFKLEYLFLRK